MTRAALHALAYASRRKYLAIVAPALLSWARRERIGWRLCDVLTGERAHLTNEHNDRAWQDSPHPHSGALAVIAAADADSQVHPGSTPPRFSWPWLKNLVAQLVKFGLIGGLGIFVDLGVYTLLRTTILTPEEHALGPMVAKVIATLVAILWSWLGNRYWTFRNDRASGPQATREGLEFLAVSLAGMVIGLIPLWITHYGFGWTSLVVDNLANLVGIGLGSVFRFVLYRWWVYSPSRLHRQDAVAAVTSQVTDAQTVSK